MQRLSTGRWGSGRLRQSQPDQPRRWAISRLRRFSGTLYSGSLLRSPIRTFWIGLLYLAIGIPLCVALIGFPILAWWFIWSLIRIVKGSLSVIEHKPIVNPGSWLFG
jgi:uncharacterized membrane protein